MINSQIVLIEQLLNEVNNCDVILELGANVGSITSRLILKGKTVYAFEPEPVAFHALKNINANNLILSNKAAWIENKKLNFYRHKDWDKTKSTTSSSLISAKKNVDSANMIEVEAIDIVDFIEKLNCRVLIKMDIEGAEYKIINKLLRSNALENITKIYCEFHPNKIKYGIFYHAFTMLNIFINRKSKLFIQWF
jgi:FkbM family methyltransferase